MKTPTTTHERQRMANLRANGFSIEQVARIVGRGKSTVHRLCADPEPAPQEPPAEPLDPRVALYRAEKAKRAERVNPLLQEAHAAFAKATDDAKHVGRPRKAGPLKPMSVGKARRA